MQPEPSRIASTVGVSEANTVAAARELWSRGDFETCLAVLDRSGIPDDGVGHTEVCLLRARALYRLRRFADVEAFLAPLLSTFTQVDEACTVRMLYAGALARGGALERGLALLEQVAASADNLHAHKAVRAEIAHARALAYWIRRDLERAERFARIAEFAQADIISVRATHLRGFVAIAQQRYENALALFRQALERYRTCRERDVDLAEVTVYEIANLEQMLLSERIRGTHGVPWGRSFRREEDPKPTHPSVARMQTEAFDAWLFAHEGDRGNAFRKMRRAEQGAPNAFWRVWALAGRARISHAFGAEDDSREHAVEAAEVAMSLDWQTTQGEERIALLLLAEALTPHDGSAASDMLHRYDTLATPMNANEVLSDDPRREALESYVRGLILRARGCKDDARTQLATAYRIFKSCGNLWRAVLALLELDATPAAVGPRRDHYLETATLLVRRHFPRSFLARRFGRWLRAHDDPVVGALTPAPRDILRNLLDGKVPKEIAVMKSLAEGTVRNHVADLEAAFGVHSIQELIVACYQRGLGSASWSDDVDPTRSPPELARDATPSHHRSFKVSVSRKDPTAYSSREKGKPHSAA